MRGRWLTPDAPGSGYICRTLKIPNSIAFLAMVNGALRDLTLPWNFEQSGALTPDQTAALFQQMYEDYVQERGCMIGTVFAAATAFLPEGSIACDGGTYLRVDYPRLYEVIHPVFIIDADHFRTPDLRGRSIVGFGQGPGLTMRYVDNPSGAETVTLDVGQIPAHNHSIYYTPLLVAAPGELPINSLFGALPVGTTDAGGDGSHNNMHPYVGLYYAIWAR